MVAPQGIRRLRGEKRRDVRKNSSVSNVFLGSDAKLNAFKGVTLQLNI